MAKLLFTPLAESDINGILDYIAEHRPLTAGNVVLRIRECCDKIAAFPELGKVRPEFPGNYRSFPLERWVIFYRVAADTVEIHRVLDGGRDIESLLS